MQHPLLLIPQVRQSSGIQEQTQFKLEPAKGSVEVLVIDQVERPSEN